MVGEPFLSFQWDVLLTETLFLSLFFLPQCGLHRFSKSNGFPRISRLLLVALLAKLMIESGVVNSPTLPLTEPIPGKILPL